MRKVIILAAAVPFFMLAACGDSTPAEQADPEPANTMGLATPEPAAMPEVPDNSLSSVDFAGTYTMTGLDGSLSSITLKPDDDSYEFTAGDGTKSSGKFQRMDDGRRIMIEDFDGRAGYFAIADGAIYRLPDADTGVDQITVTGMYARQNGTAPQGGPGATTNNVQDKRS